MPSTLDAPRAFPVSRVLRSDFVRESRLADAVRTTGQWATALTFERRYNRAIPGPATVLNFHPMRPHPAARITKICALLGLRIGHDVHGGGPMVAWETATWFASRAARQLPPRTINGTCLDISKSRVDDAWLAVAGYAAALDPLATTGPVVVKSERNGRHDGRVIPGPLPRRRKGVVYQRYIDTADGDSITALRTSIIDGQVVTALCSWRPATRWSAEITRLVDLVPEAVFSPDEMKLLIRFAARIGLDYGELDVLRDVPSGLIYVVDANRTPYGPSHIMPSAEAAKVTARQAERFAAMMAARWP